MKPYAVLLLLLLIYSVASEMDYQDQVAEDSRREQGW